MKKLLAWFSGLLVAFFAGGMALAASVTPGTSTTCQGKFLNPITDICWSCMFPLKVGSGTLLSMGQEDNNSSGGQPFCYCANGTLNPKIGVKTDFWEPARLFEAVRSPHCYVSLGGVTLDPGINAPAHAQKRKGEASPNGTSFYNVHWYVNPIMYWLEVVLDNQCLEHGSFDVAYATEYDPLWSDSQLSFILSPDSSLFANPIAQAACAADCVASTAGFPLNALFWCAGCQGSMYPLTGWVHTQIGGVQASTLLMQRMTNKLHRQGLMWAGSGNGGLCGFYPQVIMDKTNYKSQLTYPIPNTQKITGRCCQPYGRSTVITGAGKEFPYAGEDFAYQIFRKRSCCAGSSAWSWAFE